MASKYASGERDSIKSILNQKDALENIKDLKGLLSTLSYVVFILNTKRQIVYANDLLLKKLGISEGLNVSGARPGEVFACIHSNDKPEGCGTSEFCRYCNIVNVILNAGSGNVPNTEEARVVVNKNGVREQLDLEVSASPFYFAENEYIVFSVQDITDKKRKEILERTFFHDIINLAGSLDGIMELMGEMTCEEREKFILTARRISNSLIDEILAQQELSKAESNELKVNPEAYELNELIRDSIAKIQFHEVAKDLKIRFIEANDSYGIITDKVLLNRILINMMKNALEASKQINSQITVLARKKSNAFEISVHNNTLMSDRVQKQVFQRSFSTKGIGRGIGTYSMKLLGERYLKGAVDFVSNKKEGTIFKLVLPLNLND